MRHCVPFGEETFKWGQVKTKIYSPTGQVDSKLTYPILTANFKVNMNLYVEYTLAIVYTKYVQVVWGASNNVM